jgi:pectinesterase
MHNSMKMRFLLCALLLCSSAVLNAAIKVTVRNTLNIERRSETVELNWKQVSTLDPAITPANVAVLKGKSVLPSQCIDEDGDGVPELLLFQLDLAPRALQTVTVQTAAKQQVFASCADARFEVPREDVAWESDRIAYRIYGPALAAEVDNGVDVWVKRVRSLVVDKWYSASAAAKKDTYHEDHGEGADFFSVGRSLGAGGCAIMSGDSLMQPGVFTTHKIQATGPIRAMFTVTYEKGKINGVPFKEVKRYSIDAGHNLNRIVVTCTGIGNGNALRLAAGLVKRKGVTCQSDTAAGWMALWGPVNDDPVNEALGIGCVLPRGSVVGTKELKDQFVLTTRVKDGIPVTYYAGAGWTRSGDFATQADWSKLLDQWSLRVANPVVVIVKKI